MALKAFLNVKHVFTPLPTGFGKSLLPSGFTGDSAPLLTM